MPVYILILEFPVKHAIPLASATVLGGAVANNILNARKKHPDHPLRPAIDWDLILQLEPMTILGALFGAALTDLLPEVVLVVLMVLLLTVTANKTLSTAQKLHVKESEQLLKAHGEGEAKKLLANADDYIEHYVGLQRNDNTKTDDDGSWSSDEKVSNAIQTLEQSAGEPSWRDDCDHQVFLDAAKLSALFALITFINLLKGNVGEDGGGPVSPIDSSYRGPTTFWLMLTYLLCFLIFRWD